MAKKKFIGMPDPKGWRPGTYGKKMQEVHDSISPEEVERVRQQRIFDSLEKDTFNWKLALHLDPLRVQKRILMEDIGKILISTGTIYNNMARCQRQLDSGKIVEEVKDGVTMNKSELLTHNLYQLWTKLREVRQIGPKLTQLRGLVGHTDYVKLPVFPLEEYLAFVEETEEKLKRMGHSIFD